VLSNRTLHIILMACAIFLITAGGISAQPIATADVDGILVETGTGHTLKVRLDAKQGRGAPPPEPHQDEHNDGMAERVNDIETPQVGN
jgi:hypothetical protein